MKDNFSSFPPHTNHKNYKYIKVVISFSYYVKRDKKNLMFFILIRSVYILDQKRELKFDFSFVKNHTSNPSFYGIAQIATICVDLKKSLVVCNVFSFMQKRVAHVNEF